jgi:hypothetical protein
MLEKCYRSAPTALRLINEMRDNAAQSIMRPRLQPRATEKTFGRVFEHRGQRARGLTRGLAEAHIGSVEALRSALLASTIVDRLFPSGHGGTDVSAGREVRAACPDTQKNASVRISMLSRGSALGGEVGSRKAVCAVHRAQPSWSES